MTQYFVGIDCGSTMVKAAVFDQRGSECGMATRKIEHIYQHTGWTEQCMDALWARTCEVIRDAVAQAAIDPKAIVCVSCTGHGNGLYLVDANGFAVRNGIISSDTRARSYVEKWQRDGVLATVIAKTMQTLWAGQPNAILRWLHDNEPESLRRARHVFMCKDFVRYRLTGEAFAELTDMSGTSLLDVGKADYDDELLDAWGLRDYRNLLPPLRRSSDICGNVTPDAATATGLVAGTPVAAGMFDIDACGLAVGMTDESIFCMIAGTWGNNQYISTTPIVSEEMFMTSRYSIDGYYLMLEGSATSASNLEWFVSQFFESDKALFAFRGDETNIYNYCSNLVAQTDPRGDNGIVFLPFLYGNPVDHDAKCCLFGLDGRHTRADVVRAIFEGIVFGHRWHAERLFRFRPRPGTIRLTGGAVNSPVWAQMFADVFQIPIEVPAGTELGCLGAAIGGAVAVGIAPDYAAACKAMVAIDRVYHPNPDLAETYQHKYERYKHCLDALAPAWSRIAE
ncbi:MAG: FGGY-family carbohydrate kinase [Thermoguttaceae bacterium]